MAVVSVTEYVALGNVQLLTFQIRMYELDIFIHFFQRKISKNVCIGLKSQVWPYMEH